MKSGDIIIDANEAVIVILPSRGAEQWAKQEFGNNVFVGSNYIKFKKKSDAMKYRLIWG